MNGEPGREPDTPAGASGHTDEGGAAEAAQAGADAPATPFGDGAAPRAGDRPAEGASPSSARDGAAGGSAAGGDHDMSAFEADVEDSELTKAMGQIGQLGDDLAHAKADLYNLNQEYGNYVRRAKEAASGHREMGRQEVVESLIGVLDDIDAARTHGELEGGPFASIAQKLEDTLSTRFGLERFGAVGDAFDPALHEALMARTSAEVDHPVVAQVLQPGYRMGDRVLRPTKVLVENPE